MDELQVIDARIDGLLDAAEAAGGLTPELKTKHDALVRQREEAAARKRNSVKRDSAGTQRRTQTAPPVKLPATAAPGRKIRMPNGCEVDERYAANPYKGFASHTDFLRSVMEANRGQIESRLKPLHMGESEGYPAFLMPAAFTPNVRVHPLAGLYHANGKSATAGSDEHGTYSNPYGGFLANQSSMSGNFMQLEPEADPMGAATTKVPMETPVVEIAARTDKDHTTSVSGGFVVYRRAETQAVTATRGQMEMVKLEATPLMGLTYATNEILERSAISFLALLQKGMADEFAAKLIRERLRGTGAGQFEGVLNTACIVTLDAQGGQGADTINKENIDEMVSRNWRYGSAIWLANHDTLPQLMSLVQTVGTGGAAVNYFQMAPGGQATLLGRPLFFSEFMPKLGDTGDLLLGNWSEYLEGEYSPMQNAESMHVRFVEHEMAFKFWKENAGKVWWRSALTPAVSSKTLSPFVKLPAR